MKNKINYFGHTFLSNFYPSKVMYKGIVFPTVEHAFQAAKTKDKELQIQISKLKDPAYAKRKGRQLKLREDWEDIKVDIMYKLLQRKFRNKEMRRLLLQTGDKELIEGNWWNDTFWGVCNGVGENNLGKLLMKVRGEITNESLL